MNASPVCRRLLPLLPLLGLLLPQVASAGDPPSGDVGIGVELDPSIYGGTPVEPCGWPTAVYVSFGGWVCSGTLVHPDIVITAAHCPDTPNGRNATISFGEGFGGGSRDVGATCYSNPNYDGNVGDTDYAYCKLNQSVTDVPIIPPAFGCDTSALSVGREVVIVGFGQSDNGGSGSKREVTTVINGVGLQAAIGGGGKGSCQGDSGGPVYIKLKSDFGGDDTWRAFGITSGGVMCGQSSVFALMHVAIPWIETHSGIDITPCHDSDGTWAPTPACGGIPLDPANGMGAWSSGCSDGPVSGFSALCGEAFGSGDDPDPPTVDIVSPTSGTVFMLPDPNSQVNVSISVNADDGDGFGVANVRLRINGQEFPGNTDASEPYTWELVFGAGGFVIEAIATDYVGNESTPDIVAIGIDQDAPPLPGNGDGDGDGDAGDGDGDAGDGDGDGDGGITTTAGGTTGPGFDGGGESGANGCACASAERSNPAGTLALLGLFGLFGLRRRQRV